MHRRRDTVRRYLKQQYGYGKAEALLERKWPSRYNRAGSSRWSGRIYDSPATGATPRRAMIRYGTWGSGLFQSIYEPAPGALSNLLLAPELLLLIAALGAISALGIVWTPLLLALPFFTAGIAASLWRAAVSGWCAHQPVPGRSRLQTLVRRGLTAALFLLQPLARLAGRLRNGLSPWRRRFRPEAAWPRARTVELWSERWREPQAWVQCLQDALAARGASVRSGGPFDRWDLDLRAGPLGTVRIRTAVEEHGSGRQLVRARILPRTSTGGAIVASLLLALSISAWLEGRAGVGATIAVAIVLIFLLALEGTGTAMNLALTELDGMHEQESRDRLNGKVAPEHPPIRVGVVSRSSRPPAPLLPREPEAAMARRLTAQPRAEDTPR
jgi:O-antigen biosynthesis protein